MPEETRLFDYPADLASVPFDSSDAKSALVDWVEAGIEAARQPRSRPPTTTPGFLEDLFPLRETSSVWKRQEPAPPLIELSDPLWPRLASEYSLSEWVYMASRDAEIAAVYGTSTKIFDEPWWNLVGEALSFLNDMIYRHDLLSSLERFRADLVGTAADKLWEGLSAGVETYEIGTYVGGLQVDSRIGSITVDDGITLEPISGDWAKLRFFPSSGSRSNERWRAIAVRIQRPYRPGQVSNAEDAKEREQEALDRGLRILRLVHPIALLGFGRYRIGVSGHRSTPQPLLDAPKLGTVPRSARVRVSLTAQKRRALSDLTSLLSANPNLRKSFDSNASGKLALALQSQRVSSGRRRWQDRIVDLAVAFETLLGREMTEVAYKLAMRSGVLLGTSEAEARRAYDTGRAFYKLRSGLVHGNEKEVNKNTTAILQAWYGESAEIPHAVDARGHFAAQASADFVSRIIVAFLHLSANQAPIAPLVDEFLGRLDRAAFDRPDRRTIQRLAKLSNYLRPVSVR